MRRPYSAYKDSGAAWVGKVPEHWRVEKFRWVTKLSNQKNVDDVERPMLSLSAYDGIKFKKYEYETQKRSEEQNMVYMVVKPKQLVVNPMWVMKRSIAVSELDGIVSPAYRVYDISDDYLPKYFHYLMRSDIYVDEYNRHIRGLTTYDRSVRKDDFAQLLVPIPPIDEQKAIVAFLEGQTAVINQFLTNKRRLIALLEEQKQVVINTAVTQGLDTAVLRKPSGIEWLGDIPAHWKIKKLWYMIDMVGGSTPSKEKSDYWTNGTIPWISPKDMKSLEISSSIDRITEKAIQETSIQLINPPVILMVVRGLILARTIPIALTKIPLTINQDMKAMRVKTKDSTKFLSYLLRGMEQIFMALIEDSGHGTKRFRTNDLKQIFLAMPPIEEQETILDFIETKTAEINTAIERTQREIELIEEYRTTLISTAVTGKIDVRFSPWKE